METAKQKPVILVLMSDIRRHSAAFMECSIVPIKTAKPPAVRGQRLCLRPQTLPWSPDTARWGIEPAEELDTRFD